MGIDQNLPSVVFFFQWIGFVGENLNRKPMGFYHQIVWGFRLKFSHHPIIYDFCRASLILGVEHTINHQGFNVVTHVIQKREINPSHVWSLEQPLSGGRQDAT